MNSPDQIERSKMKPKVVIQGWYGNGNLGDEMILECMLAQIRENFPHASFVVISDDPADTKMRHGVNSIARGGGRVQRLRRFFTLMQADLFILGGGGLLKQWGTSDLSILTWLGPLDLAREMGVPTMTYAIGVSEGLSSRSERVLSEILGRTDVVLVRDSASLVILKGIGVSGAKLTADPALLLSELHPQAAKPSPLTSVPKISVFLTHWYVTRNDVPELDAWSRFESALAQCLDYLVEAYSASVKFVPMGLANPIDDDREVARRIVGLMRRYSSVQVVEGEVSSEELLALLSESKLVIGMRLHSLIAAAAKGIPAIAIDYQSKVRHFSDDAGASEWVIGIRGSTTDLLERLSVKALTGGYPLAQVREKVSELQALARENGRSAASLIQAPKKANHLLSRIGRGTVAMFRRLMRRKSWE